MFNPHVRCRAQNGPRLIQTNNLKKSSTNSSIFHRKISPFNMYVIYSLLREIVTDRVGYVIRLFITSRRMCVCTPATKRLRHIRGYGLIPLYAYTHGEARCESGAEHVRGALLATVDWWFKWLFCGGFDVELCFYMEGNETISLRLYVTIVLVLGYQALRCKICVWR